MQTSEITSATRFVAISNGSLIVGALITAIATLLTIHSNNARQELKDGEQAHEQNAVHTESDRGSAKDQRCQIYCGSANAGMTRRRRNLLFPNNEYDLGRLIRETGQQFSKPATEPTPKTPAIRSPAIPS